MTVDTIASSDIIIEFPILLVVLLTSCNEIWRKEHLWIFSVLQRVYLLKKTVMNFCTGGRQEDAERI
jgi:hypothetical protein